MVSREILCYFELRNLSFNSMSRVLPTKINLWSHLSDIDFFEGYQPPKNYLNLVCHLNLTLAKHNVHFYK